MDFWWATFNLTICTTLQAATLQAHVILGLDFIQRMKGNCGVTNDLEDAFISKFAAELRRHFGESINLTTGLGMELIWKHYQPPTVSNQSQLSILQDLKQVAQRFDSVRWQTSMSITDIGNIVKPLLDAHNFILTRDADGQSLITSLSVELDNLEKGVRSCSQTVTPYFAPQFEHIRQLKALAHMSSSTEADPSFDIGLAILANSPSTVLMAIKSKEGPAKQLGAISQLCSTDDALYPVFGDLSFEVLCKLDTLGSQELFALQMTETEVPILGEKLTSLTTALCQDQLSNLMGYLDEIVRTILLIHPEDFRARVALHRVKIQVVSSAEATVPPWISWFKMHHMDAEFCLAIAEQAISAARHHQDNAVQYASLAWVAFAVSAILLYIPDKPYDPDEKRRVQHRQHEQKLHSRQKKLEALQAFERMFSGQETNLRCQILIDDIKNLELPEQESGSVFRPDVSELDQLQGDFNNILKLVVDSHIFEVVTTYLQGKADGATELKLFQRNIQQMILRLENGYFGYEDLTSPATSFLRFLQVGLVLAEKIPLPSQRAPTQPLALMAPMISEIKPILNEDMIASRPIEFLSYMKTKVAVEGLESLDHQNRQNLFRCLHGQFETWLQKLESDRLENESKTGLYRFRGTADDDEHDVHEFEELFPAFDDSEETTVAGVQHDMTRDRSIEMAAMHANIFLSPKSPLPLPKGATVLDHLRRVSRAISRLPDKGQSYKLSNVTNELLPAALLILDDSMRLLKTSSQIKETYNFYADANLPEVRNVISLVRKVIARFRELQADDEIGHMQPLLDVLTACGEVLQFRQKDPLAKIITKLEKLHTFVHEWEFGGWVSRTYSCRELYDSLTNILVSWRRLELSTWARLFSLETEKCDDDARSWWFIAYQVVVAAPMAIVDKPEELQSYAPKLLKDLETYFSSAIVGQFSQRLRLLAQLDSHLEQLTKDYPAMHIIRQAVGNFLRHYSNFEGVVQDYLSKGRVALDKAMRDILLLASWKDTNIIALRDSAKRSHHKLFKIVRKFRALLGQSMDSIIKQGLPEGQSTTVFSELNAPIDHQIEVDDTALAVCAAQILGWLDKPQRFLNVAKTVAIMAKAQHVDGASESLDYLTSYITHLTTTAEGLRKLTPSVLTEENKDAVKHLKTRKRKLFADVLKDLRVWGVKYNLGEQDLQKQAMISLVLSTSNTLVASDGSTLEGANYYFDRLNDSLPKVREAARQAHEDLSSAEVLRSLGYLEGAFALVLRQRRDLSTFLESRATLRHTVRLIKALSKHSDSGITKETSQSDVLPTLQWLPELIAAAVEILKTYERLGGENCSDVQDKMHGFSIDLEKLLDAQITMPSLPHGLEYSKSQVATTQVNDLMTEITNYLTDLEATRSDLSFVLNKIRPWTVIKTTAIVGSGHEQTIHHLDEKLSAITDMILSAVQDYESLVAKLHASSESDWSIAAIDIKAKIVSAMKLQTIVHQLDSSFTILHRTDLTIGNARTSSARYGALLPILEQYLKISEASLESYSNSHIAWCKLTYTLSKHFIQIASKGFCTPSEKSEDQDDKNQKLESGTGLGDGEGAEDISKDIQADEDLDELAQEPNTGDREEMENEQDAVDMADADMEGEMGDAEEQSDDEKENGSGDESDNEMDEEAGSVDDLDPSAVDEKKWDGDEDQADKDQEGNDDKGTKSHDNAAAAEDGQELGEDDEIEEDITGAEQEETMGQDEVEKHDSKAADEEALDLPDDMELDGGQDNADGDDDSHASDDVGDDLDQGDDMNEQEDTGNEVGDGEDVDGQEDQDNESELDVVDADALNEEDGTKTEEAGEKDDGAPDDAEEDQQDTLLQDREDDAMVDDAPVPSEMQGSGPDQDNKQEDQADSKAQAQREDGGKGGDTAEEQDSSADTGKQGQQADGDASQDAIDDVQPNKTDQPFKRLGDALERWHRQQKQIREPPAPQDNEASKQDADTTAENPEFQHLQDEDAEPDTQALGTATEQQAHAVDESMAIDNETTDLPDTFEHDAEVADEMDLDDADDQKELSQDENQVSSDAYEGRAGAMIREAEQEQSPADEEVPDRDIGADPDDDISEVETQLDSTHIAPIEPSDRLSLAEAQAQWQNIQTVTLPLSLLLTEQLRLILTPTHATKMRGGFRTGKRLNIKRIIPYIASSYKRDKIWMRRSVPSKRNYQIMLALDDSKSMKESGSAALALETLVMVSRSLAMLETGEVCVLGFGEAIRLAHRFEEAWGGDAGPRVLGSFGFDQGKTNVKHLVQESMELFRQARMRSPAQTDLWQLQLIISDGVCDSREHDEIRRLLRQAMEERIMMVFVVVDDVRNKKKGESVMDLKEAKFVRNEETGSSEVKIERYLDTFPFQYYLIVSDVQELPGVLAALLRQWFGEVMDSA